MKQNGRRSGSRLSSSRHTDHFAVIVDEDTDSVRAEVKCARIALPLYLNLV